MLNKRKEGRAARQNLLAAEHKVFSEIICKKIQSFISEMNVVMIYNAIDNEVDVCELNKISDKVFLYPRIEGNDIVPVCSEYFTKGAFGILEPVGKMYTDKIDVVIVPMTAFDEECNRLGFGKGFYDRFLCKNACLKIGVAFSCQKTKQIITKDTDVKMDYIITEKEILECVK